MQQGGVYARNNEPPRIQMFLHKLPIEKGPRFYSQDEKSIAQD